MNLKAKLSFLYKNQQLYKFLRTAFWFFLGAVIGFFFFSSFIYIYYKQSYKDKIYPGVSVNHVEFGGKTKEDVAAYFTERNKEIQTKKLQFVADTVTASISAKELKIGFDAELLASQAYSVGRGGDFFSDLYLSLESYLHGVSLSPAYQYSETALTPIVTQLEEKVNVDPIDARFTYENGRVTEFQTAKEGKRVDVAMLKTFLQEKSVPTLQASSNILIVKVPILTVKPEITSTDADKFGITERIGVGTSLFHGSIPNREYNLSLASSRLNGVLIKPNEVFSFAKAVGDISSFTGYKQAYVIENGRTVLGDGGGVCQVSTTLFRALLNAGLPIIERHPHAYRVHYYEEDLGPGIDAAVYIPTVDLKFKNDTGHSILIQTSVNTVNKQLTFELYGTSDGRVASISAPVILSQSPAPEPLYQDDPNLPAGQVKQIDWAAPGARVYFTYTVTKNGKKIISERYNSNYRPWQAVFLRGTKP